MQDAPHTLSIFDDDLHQLRAAVSEMGGRVEASIHDAVTALVQGHEEQARAVIADDRKIDGLLTQIERDALRMIALRMPVAGDLRDVLGALKTSMLVARMGDCSKNIAHRVPLVRAVRSCEHVKLVQAMEVEVSGMVKAALDAFVRRSAASAILVRDADGTVDDYYACLFRELTDYMRDDPDRIAAATHLLMVAQKLERIGDHAVGIAEIVHFAVTGEAMPPEQGSGVALNQLGPGA